MDDLYLIKRHFLPPGIYLRYILMYIIVPIYLLPLGKDFNVKIAQFLAIYLIYIMYDILLYNTFMYIIYI